MKKKLATTLLAGALSANMVMPAFATTNGVVPAAQGTEVWAGVVIQDKNPVVKVEVPTLFAFVVNGTTSTDASSVTSTNGNIYLPNVRVVVDKTNTRPDGGYMYDMDYTSDGKMRMNNYSTYEDGGQRVGLALTINGEIQETSTEAAERNYWTYVPSVTELSAGVGDPDQFKHYSISVDTIKLDVPTTAGYKMKDSINLDAPDTDPAGDGSYSNLDTVTKMAITPTVHIADFDVEVGGERGQYKQVEQSARVGKIVWTVSADVSMDGVKTAPDEAYLQ